MSAARASSSNAAGSARSASTSDHPAISQCERKRGWKAVQLRLQRRQVLLDGRRSSPGQRGVFWLGAYCSSGGQDVGLLWPSRHQ
ncbi:unnamed protein product [Lampetra planeri]